MAQAAFFVNDLKIIQAFRRIRAATHGNGTFERDLLDPGSIGIEGEPIVASVPSATLRVRPNPLTANSHARFTLPAASCISGSGATSSET